MLGSMGGKMPDMIENMGKPSKPGMGKPSKGDMVQEKEGLCLSQDEVVTDFLILPYCVNAKAPPEGIGRYQQKNQQSQNKNFLR